MSEHDWETAKPGTSYRVSWNDCCAKGHFAGVLKELQWNKREPDILDAAVFENGVTIGGQFWHVEIVELGDPSSLEALDCSCRACERQWDEKESKR